MCRPIVPPVLRQMQRVERVVICETLSMRRVPTHREWNDLASRDFEFADRSEIRRATQHHRRAELDGAWTGDRVPASEPTANPRDASAIIEPQNNFSAHPQLT